MTDREVRPVGGRWPMAERSLLATVLGLPPLGAIALAAVLTTVGVFVDLVRIGSLGTVFTVCFVAGCLLAVVWVRRSGLFGPMVQPPLLIAVAVPVIVLLAGSPPPGAGVAEQLLVIGAPLVNSFPIMAWTTGAVLAVGVLRMIVQRPLAAPVGTRPAGSRRPAADQRTGKRDARGDRKGDGKRGRAPAAVSERRRPAADAVPAAARRSRSPRRS
ncbi:MAG TPA: DUF6542 domain-containing protein [Pseudonocardia sp.]|jgi:hypothetical protein|nr:DUF6542 domain-containing protein [Pseudonocardia sp.]